MVVRPSMRLVPPLPSPRPGSLAPTRERLALPEPGTAVQIVAAPGGGGLTFAAACTRHLAREGRASLVVDARGSTWPHAWVPPAERGGPIWVVVPPRPDASWVAVDIALRSAAFALVVALDPPKADLGRVAPRVRQLVARTEGRLLVIAPEPVVRLGALHQLAPLPPAWLESPLGDLPDFAPSRSALLSLSLDPPRDESLLSRFETDRLRARARAPDRRPSRHARRHHEAPRRAPRSRERGEDPVV